MKLYRDYDYQKLLEIGRTSENKQVVKDVSFTRVVYHHNKKSLYCERIEDFCFIIGQVQKNQFRIIGMYTKKEFQGRGFASFLFNRCVEFCKKKGIKKITTRSLSGAEFYCKKGFDVVGMKGNDYLLTMEIKT